MNEDDNDDLVNQVKAQRQHARKLLTHPDPRDPNHPEDDEGDDE